MLELIAEEEESDTETLIESLGNLEAEEKTEVTDDHDSAVQAVAVQYRERWKKFTAKQPEFAASKYYALMKQYIDEVAGDERRKVTGKNAQNILMQLSYRTHRQVQIPRVVTLFR